MKKALFLDRDGVINHDAGYTHKIESFRFADGIFELCAAFELSEHEIFVVTNQAGIAKGMYSEQDFLRLTDWMLTQFAQRGTSIRKVYYCPFHPDGAGEYRRESPDRKPAPGMILRARDEYGIDLSASTLIGDMETDIQAGKSAGIGRNIIIGKKSALADMCFDSVMSALGAKIWE